jgi:hypothetical protein
MLDSEVVDLAAEKAGTATAVEPTGRASRVPVTSAVLAAAYRGMDYRVVAWQPLGKPAFVFLISVGERRLLQPNIADGADFDAVMQNAANFVEQLLDEDAAHQ